MKPRAAIGKRGQTLAEHAVLITTVLAAFAAVATFSVRALNARYKTLSDMAVKATTANSVQYEPYYANGQSVSVRDGIIQTKYSAGQTTRTEDTNVHLERGATQSLGTDVAADNDW